MIDMIDMIYIIVILDPNDTISKYLYTIVEISGEFLKSEQFIKAHQMVEISLDKCNLSIVYKSI